MSIDSIILLFLFSLASKTLTVCINGQVEYIVVKRMLSQFGQNRLQQSEFRYHLVHGEK